MSHEAIDVLDIIYLYANYVFLICLNLREFQGQVNREGTGDTSPSDQTGLGRTVKNAARSTPHVVQGIIVAQVEATAVHKIREGLDLTRDARLHHGRGISHWWVDLKRFLFSSPSVRVSEVLELTRIWAEAMATKQNKKVIAVCMVLLFSWVTCNGSRGCRLLL